MSARRALAEPGPHILVTARCLACGRKRPVPERVDRVLEEAPPRGPIYLGGARPACVRCGSRRVRVTWRVAEA